MIFFWFYFDQPSIIVMLLLWFYFSRLSNRIIRKYLVTGDWSHSISVHTVEYIDEHTYWSVCAYLHCLPFNVCILRPQCFPYNPQLEKTYLRACAPNEDSKSSLSACRHFVSLAIQIAQSEEYDQTERMHMSKVCFLTLRLPLRKHAYSIILKILQPKQENFQIIFIFFISHFSAQNIDCVYLLEPPRRGGSNELSQSMFLSRKNEK